MDRASVRRLRTGIVPGWHVEPLSVGYGSARRTIDAALEALVQGQEVPPLYVRGEWGTGKTHLLSYVRARALSRGVVGGFVSLNGRSLPLNLPQRLYGAITDSLSCKTSLGLREIVLDLLHESQTNIAVGQFLTERFDAPLAEPVRNLMRAVRDHDASALLDVSYWSRLLGEDIRNVAASSKREVAFERLQFLADLFRAAGLGGLVLILDEAETIDQLWNIRSRAVAYNVMWRFTKMRNVWCLFGVTDRFRITVNTDRSNQPTLSLSSRLDDAASSYLKSWAHGKARVLDAPHVDGSHALELARTITALYDRAYGLPSGTEKIASEALAQWRLNPSRNPRRLIRLVVHHCDIAREVLQE